MQVVLDNADAVAWAFAMTALLFVVAGVVALVLGTLLAACRVGPIAVLRGAGAFYVTVVRNTPLIIIIFFFRYAGPKVGLTWSFVDVQFGNVNLNQVYMACTVGLAVYTSAFVAEAIRSGVNAVPVGQAEAARAIGMPFSGVMRHIVLPQAFRATVPPLASVQIALLKNTTVAGTVGVLEAFARMRGLTNDYAGDRFAIFFAISLVFVVLVELVSFGAHRLEKRWRTA